MNIRVANMMFPAVCLLALACSPQDPMDYGRATHPIVNGTTTSGWPAVGALVLDYNGQWQNFCTGTLINSEWVLTAAHCVDVDITGVPDYAMSFYIGPDARFESGGSTYEVSDAFYHSGWTGNGGNDIALVHLASYVSSSTATPIPYSTYSLSDYRYEPIRWVGYGLDDGYQQTGSGIKRTATGSIDNVYSTDIYYGVGSGGTMPCSGDSGGATLMEIAGTERLVGVISRGDQYCVSDGIDTRVDAYQDWIAENTGGASSCAITGGDCGYGEACALNSDGGFSCFDSQGVGEGQSCNPNLSGTVACADGLYCLPVAGSGICRPYCEVASDCGTGLSCFHLSGQSFGYCGCTDEDNDGYCNFEDCNDDNAYIHPGASDTCANNVDDDCDGATDEGCCQDLDSDGYMGFSASCPGGVDCDDTNNTVNPGRQEACANGFDDDCDGFTDEGCGECVDLDGDDYCDDIDCDDHDSRTYPGATEGCGDGRDNDCDGLTDETCGNCASDAECDDGNPCTRDACGGGACVYEDEPDGMACGEDMMCQIGECFPTGGGGSDGCSTAGQPAGLTLLGLLLLGLVRKRRSR